MMPITVRSRSSLGPVKYSQTKNNDCIHTIRAVQVSVQSHSSIDQVRRIFCWSVIELAATCTDSVNNVAFSVQSFDNSKGVQIEVFTMTAEKSWSFEKDEMLIELVKSKRKNAQDLFYVSTRRTMNRDWTDVRTQM
ncbi:uncharacterized protein LOC128864968 [Anastrepha ludens]|uniref:uncharacterized protein LOC128864968 n=1 Tax=Anastrepha ludens TaxID=28586 RepID=UPI0023B0F4BA|nr:uncharacterized protein LOC128864968 [Anastrepha ludens]